MKDLKKILICEDEEILLTALKFRLQKQGYELFLTADGAEAEAVLKKERPDMLITDIDVPKKNGLELVNFIRQDLEWDIPIIMIAPMEEGEEILKAKKAGATDFVTKPFKPVELVLRIRCIFQAIDH
ncbi:MAG: response regulator [Phaeodactylibacter sp.]|uniref:response regulator n=1 Tax=Phaeodactylibacter sp. TaxID=1940289 RepID=UPI0032ED3EC9